MVMCTKLEFSTLRQVLQKSDTFGGRTPFGAGGHPGLGSVLPRRHNIAQLMIGKMGDLLCGKDF